MKHSVDLEEICRHVASEDSTAWPYEAAIARELLRVRALIREAHPSTCASMMNGCKLCACFPTTLDVDDDPPGGLPNKIEPLPFDDYRAGRAAPKLDYMDPGEARGRTTSP